MRDCSINRSIGKSSQGGKVEAIALDFLRCGGKRLRPRLLREVYGSIVRGGADARSLDPLAEAVECFHKASLIHDDIQDGDTERYGKPAIWAEHGIPLAIAVGDWLVATGYRLIAESGFPNRAEMLTATVRSHVRLCEGQGDELAGEGTYLSICERKTGEAFALAASLGALAAGADDRAYRAWGLTFGVLFQVRDDKVDSGTTDELERLEHDYARRLAEFSVGPFLMSEGPLHFNTDL